MTTRRKFTGGLLASGMLANFALVAAPKEKSSGNNGNPCNGHGKADQCHGNGAKADTVTPPSPCNDQCHGNGAKADTVTPPDPCNGHGKADQCRGNGAKADTVTPPDPCKSSARMGEDQTPPPACKSASGKEDHVE